MTTTKTISEVPVNAPSLNPESTLQCWDETLQSWVSYDVWKKTALLRMIESVHEQERVERLQTAKPRVPKSKPQSGFNW